MPREELLTNKKVCHYDETVDPEYVPSQSGLQDEMPNPGTINRVSPRISTPPEILQVGTPFRDVTNRNKFKRSSGDLSQLKKEFAELQSRFKQLENACCCRRTDSTFENSNAFIRRNVFQDKDIYEDTEGSTEFTEPLEELYLQNLNLSFNQPEDEIMEVSVEN